MGYTTVGDDRIYYETTGDGFPVVLLHSLGGSTKMWRRTVDALSASFRVVTFDARGHGRSTGAGEISVARFADDAVAVAEDVLGATKFHAVGISMGGQAAMHIALRRPDRVARIVVADTAAGGPPPPGPDRIAAAAARIAEIPARQFAQEYAASRLRPWNVAVARDFAGDVVATLPDVYVRMLRSIVAQDLRADLARIKTPALVLVGENDVSTPPPLAEALARGIAGAQFQTIPDANHLANLDQPEIFNRLVRDFLAA